MLDKIIFAAFFSFSLYFTVNGQQTQDNLSPQIINIVSKLRQERTLHLGNPVGYGGMPETNNKYYILYQNLKAKGTDRELYLLTNDSSKTIVLYSFLILCSRNYPGLKDIFLQHLNDTTYVWIAGGCTGIVDRVNSFMLSQLDPSYNGIGKTYLTKDEYDEYLKIVSKTNR